MTVEQFLREIPNEYLSVSFVLIFLETPVYSSHAMMLARILGSQTVHVQPAICVQRLNPFPMNCILHGADSKPHVAMTVPPNSNHDSMIGLFSFQTQ